jgi:hypothetical protein
MHEDHSRWRRLLRCHFWQTCPDSIQELVSSQESPQPGESIAHGSQIRNNFHDEPQRDAFLHTINRASAFLFGVELNPFMDSKMDNYLKFKKGRDDMQEHDPEAAAAEEAERRRQEAVFDRQRVRE